MAGSWMLLAAMLTLPDERSEPRSRFCGDTLCGELGVGGATPAPCDMSLYFLPGHHDESEEIDSRNKETVVGGTDSLPKLRDAAYI